MLNKKTQKALEKVAALCSKSEKCTYDIRKKLAQYNLNENEVEEIINYLIENKFIDEERYAEFFVRDKFRFNRWGKIKIAYMLKAKNISPSLIKLALDQIDKEEYKNTLQELISNKNKSIKADNEFERNAKLTRFAAGRGYEPELIRSLIFD